MKLQLLVVKDFGPFRGRHTIDLRDVQNSSTFAIFGEENGRGKTTLYNAMKWALFGEVFERAKTESGKKISGSKRPVVREVGEGRFLMNLEHLQQDDKHQMEVVLFADGERGQIQITRTATSSTTLPRNDDELTMDLSVYVGDNAFSGRDAQEQIESFFPRELERFFFVDGEDLEGYSEMMDEDSVVGIKSEIISILRLPALTRGRSDFEEIQRSVSSSIKVGKRDEKIADKVRNESNKHKQDLRTITKQMGVIQEQINSTNKLQEEIINKLKVHEQLRVHIEKRAEIKNVLSVKEENILRSKSDLVKFAKSAWKVLISDHAKPIFEGTKLKLEEINSSKGKETYLREQLSKRKEELEQFEGLCITCNQPLPDVEKYRQNMISEIESLENNIAKLTKLSNSEQDYLQECLTRTRKFIPEKETAENIATANVRWKEDRIHVIGLQEELDRLEERISNSNAQEAEDLLHKRGQYEELLKNYESKFRELEAKADVLTIEIRRLDRIGKVDGLDQSNLILDDMLSRFIKTIDDTIEEYTNQARQDVEIAASEIFNQVTNSPTVFDGIKLDNNFRASIKFKKGGTVVADSSGMNAMKTLSVIDGLRTVSGLKAPFFFDTPGRSLSKSHKKLMLDYFSRESEEQFFIFAHDGEYEIEETLNEYGDRIGKAWSLTWPCDWVKCPECNHEGLIPTGKNDIVKCLECEFKFDASVHHTTIKQLEW